MSLYLDRHRGRFERLEAKKESVSIPIKSGIFFLNTYSNQNRFINRFGENCKPEPPRASIIESIKQTVREILWVVIGATALLSTLLSFFIGEWKEGAEGLSIIFMSLILISITSLVDYVKDRKFIELFSLVKEESLPVIRGKLGATQTISVWEMVVGDVVLLGTGDMVPADCLVINSTNLKVDEPYSLNKGVSKGEEDPVLLAGSLVSNGQCKALVCVVGA